MALRPARPVAFGVLDLHRLASDGGPVDRSERLDDLFTGENVQRPAEPDHVSQFAQPFANVESHAASVDRGDVQRGSDLDTRGRCIRLPDAVVVSDDVAGHTCSVTQLKLGSPPPRRVSQLDQVLRASACELDEDADRCRDPGAALDCGFEVPRGAFWSEPAYCGV